MADTRHRLQIRLSDAALEMLEELKQAHGDTAFSTVIERAIKSYYMGDELVTKMRRRHSMPRASR